MLRSFASSAWCLFVWVAVAPGQQLPAPQRSTTGTATPAADGATDGGSADGAARGGTERTLRGTCSDAASRDLFSACDADGDDRLDVFEASSALDGVRAPGDHDGFGQLDRDRDGYLTWPEFDAALQRALARGSPFRVRTVRPVVATAPPARAATPMQLFLQLHDANQNGGLDPTEIESFLVRGRLPVEMGKRLRALDTDRSGRLEEAELSPWFVLLTGAGAAAPALPAAGSALPPPWSAADADQGGAIDASELRTVLRRLDPALATWAAELLRALDRDRDGALQPHELPAAAGGTTAAAASPGGQLPLRAPVR